MEPYRRGMTPRDAPREGHDHSTFPWNMLSTLYWQKSFFTDRQRNHIRRRQQTKNLMQQQNFWNSWLGLPTMTFPQHKTTGVEDLPPICHFQKWQLTSYPNCNEIHEIDLADIVRTKSISMNKKRRLKIMYSLFQHNTTEIEVGYVDSGLWRSVWKVDPRQESQEWNQVPAVLKMMKGTHDVDHRNMERHRREALVMEKLTSSPHIVSMYAHCGNSILTEYIPVDLNVVINWKNDHGFPTRSTPEGRLKLALGVAKGIEALHNIEGGPVIHADVSSTQFMVDRKGNIKLNDFNRCRFLPYNNVTGEVCDVRIPTAPGTSRSPEEYEFKALNEKVDIYSVGNVIYEILTGEEPWAKEKPLVAQENVKAGEIPAIDEDIILLNSTDAGLVRLMELSMKLNVTERINASDLVHQLEQLTSLSGE
jgi:serine/threonine protein kinase